MAAGLWKLNILTGASFKSQRQEHQPNIFTYLCGLHNLKDSVFIGNTSSCVRSIRTLKMLEGISKSFAYLKKMCRCISLL